ncbi:MAG: hypothetical protein IT163_14255 [Bryobacterales bacterium]|nr:hypothetical protein [Bryobacterales bacterium]
MKTRLGYASVRFPQAYGLFCLLAMAGAGTGAGGRAEAAPPSQAVRRKPPGEVGRSAAPRANPSGCLEQNGPAVNPKATADTRSVLAYFRGLPEQSGRRVVSGQFIGSGNYATTKEIDSIRQQTGKMVAMMGIDYALMHGTDTTANFYAIRHWNAGGLVTVSFHALNPQTRGFGSVKNRKINFQDLFQEGSKAHQNWIADLDKAAAGLAELQAHNVVVLWRPFHEMNKDYFWWGNRDTGEFVRLWRQTFDYLTKTKGLNNLLWVYSPYQAADTTKYFPGDAYVDIVSMDAYETNPEKIQGYEALAALDKPFGFAEYGPSGNLLVFIPLIEKNVDYYGIFNTILRKFPKTSFLHAWNGGWGFQSHRNISQLMNDPRLITQSDVNWRSACK